MAKASPSYGERPGDEPRFLGGLLGRALCRRGPPLAITSYLAWYSAVRDQCEKSGGTLYMPNPLTLACVKPERIPLT